MTIRVKVGDPVPLFVAVDDESDEYVINARVLVRSPYEVLEESLPLAYIEYSPGEYENLDFDMPDVPFLDVIYTVFESDGTTQLRKASEIFLRDDGGSSDDSLIVGIVTDETELVGIVNPCED